MNKSLVHNKEGFTLVELMITLVISSLIVAALYATYILQQRSYTNQGSVTEMQQNVRVGIDFLTLDLRMAGYDPMDTGVGGITVANSNSISFTADMDKNGVIGGGTENEYFSYDLDLANPRPPKVEPIPTLRRSATTDLAPVPQPMADYIENIEFLYFFEDATPPSINVVGAANLAKIRSVQITVLARAADRDRNYTNTTAYTTASGVVWPAVNDNYRRRLLTTRIDLRNMGL